MIGKRTVGTFQSPGFDFDFYQVLEPVFELRKPVFCLGYFSDSFGFFHRVYRYDVVETVLKLGPEHLPDFRFENATEIFFIGLTPFFVLGEREGTVRCLGI